MMIHDIRINRKGPFILLDGVTRLDENGLSGFARCNDSQPYFGIEAAAQACAFHSRFADGFARHAFLLSIKELDPIPKISRGATARIDVALTGRGEKAVTYAVDMSAGNIRSNGIITIGFADYDHVFKKEDLKPYYEKAFHQLCKSLKNDMTTD